MIQKQSNNNKAKDKMATKPRKSVSLTTEQRKSLKAFIKSFHTNREAAESLGLGQSTLYYIAMSGKGSEKYITQIIKKLAA